MVYKNGENEPRNSGRIKVSWCNCPNNECPSRVWFGSGGWDVDFDGDKFQCGTCQLKLAKPMFYGLT